MSKCLVIQVSLTAAERRNWHIKLHKDKSVHCWDNIIYDYSWTTDTMLASNKKIVAKIFCVLPLCRHCQSSGSSCLGDDLECHGAEGSDDSPWVCSSPCLASCPPFYPRPSRPIMVQQTSSLRMTRMTGMQVIRCSSTDLSRWCWWDTTAGQLSQRMANIPTILGSVLNRKIWTLTQYLTIFTSGETEVCNFFYQLQCGLIKKLFAIVSHQHQLTFGQSNFPILRLKSYAGTMISSQCQVKSSTVQSVSLESKTQVPPGASNQYHLTQVTTCC